MDDENDEIDKMMDVTAMKFLLVQNRQQTHEIGLDEMESAYTCVIGFMVP